MKKLLSLMLIIAAAISCTDDDLKPEGDFTGPKIVGFGTNFESVAYFEDEGVVDRTFPINLIGLGNGQVSDQPIEITYTIDTENSTATEGVEFDFADSTGKVIIPAGGTFGMFPLKVNTGNFNPTEKTQLVLKLTDASGETVVGAQYDTLSIVFVGCQSTLAGTYTLVVTNNINGFVRTYASEDIDMTDVNTFHTESTGTWLLGTMPVSDQGFQFIDICGEITVPEQNLFDYYSNLVRGISSDGVDGHVIDENSFEITYEITFAAGNQNYTGVYTRNN
ncbi:MAG TPA: hypothetical protein VFQ50_06740 [Flavobacterium sp.]|jgi:hypothetical protein|nr:hypothetical protein [Flavobacterium sp.]